MFNKLEKIKIRYNELTDKISLPEIIANNNEWKKLVKEHSSLQPIVEKYDEWKNADNAIISTQNMIPQEQDAEMKEMLHAELSELKEKKETLEEELKILLLPKDPNDDKNVIIEIRAGAGGEESALFAQLVSRMYHMFADKNKWHIEEMDLNDTEMGGIKETTFLVKGNGAYSKFKYESGVHRVQRVPETESQGRIHTSTITVAVLPEAEDVDINIEEKDLKIDTYRSSGAGGQHVNKTESAIRITHIPTGVVVSCQTQRSQLQNREQAMQMLSSKLYDLYQTQADEKYAERRKLQVGTGDRSERIRTYNFPQGRVTDHRIGFTIYSLTDFLNGNIEDMIEALRIANQTAKLQHSEN